MINEKELEETLLIKIKTTLTDSDVPTKETLKYLLEEDLHSLGYNVEFIENSKLEEENEKLLAQNRELTQCIKIVKGHLKWFINHYPQFEDYEFIKDSFNNINTILEKAKEVK